MKREALEKAIDVMRAIGANSAIWHEELAIAITAMNIVLRPRRPSNEELEEKLIDLERRETDCDQDRWDLCNWAIDYALQLDAPKTLEERIADLEKKIK